MSDSVLIIIGLIIGVVIFLMISQFKGKIKIRNREGKEKSLWMMGITGLILFILPCIYGMLFGYECQAFTTNCPMAITLLACGLIIGVILIFSSMFAILFLNITR